MRTRRLPLAALLGLTIVSLSPRIAAAQVAPGPRSAPPYSAMPAPPNMGGPSAMYNIGHRRGSAVPTPAGPQFNDPSCNGGQNCPVPSAMGANGMGADGMGMPGPVGCLPGPVYTRFVGPAGFKVVFYSPGGVKHAFDMPVNVAFIAGYRFLFAVEFPQAQGRKYFGTIDVLRGSQLPPGAKGPEAPAPIHFSEPDVTLLTRDRMITKFMVLEDPDLALPIQGTSDEPVRYQALLSEDALDMAKGLGELVLVVRIGNRIPSDEELAGHPTNDGLLIPRAVPVTDATGKERLTPEYFVCAHSGRSAQERIAEETLSQRMGGRPNPVQQANFLKHLDKAAFDRRRGCDAQGRRDCAAQGFGPVAGNGLPAVCPIGGAMTRCPWPPLREEYLCDGGDRDLKVWFDRAGGLMNIDPGDTVSAYVDNIGNRRITESNIVCVYAPRYAEIQLVLTVEGYQTDVYAEGVRQDQPGRVYVALTSDMERSRYETAADLRLRKRPSVLVMEEGVSMFTEVTVLLGFEQWIGWAQTIGVVGPELFSNVEQPEIMTQIDVAQQLTRVQFPQVVGMALGTGELVTVWKEQEIVVVEEPPVKPSPLLLEKRALSASAAIGEEVTFEIRYTNVGKEPISNIAVVDSLVSRLEYVPNSAESNRDAVFTAQANDVGSSTLRWEVKEPLAPNAAGAVRFRAKVR